MPLSQLVLVNATIIYSMQLDEIGIGTNVT